MKLGESARSEVAWAWFRVESSEVAEWVVVRLVLFGVWVCVVVFVMGMVRGVM